MNNRLIKKKVKFALESKIFEPSKKFGVNTSLNKEPKIGFGFSTALMLKDFVNSKIVPLIYPEGNGFKFTRDEAARLVDSGDKTLQDLLLKIYEKRDAHV